MGSALTDHVLEVKKEFIVMLLRNSDLLKEDGNSTRYIVSNMKRHKLQLILATDEKLKTDFTFPGCYVSPAMNQFLSKSF